LRGPKLFLTILKFILDWQFVKHRYKVSLERSLMDDTDRHALDALSQGKMTALEPRRRLRGAPYGEVLELLSEAGLPLPRAPVAGREERIARARSWLFPSHVPRPEALCGGHGAAEHLGRRTVA
jgi:hypothetical protein